MFAGSVALGVAGAHIASTTSVFAGTVSHTLTGAHIASTAALFAGSTLVTQDVAGAHISSTTTLFSGSVSQTLSGAHIASTTSLNAGSVSHTLTGAHIASTTTLFNGAVALGLSGPPLLLPRSSVGHHAARWRARSRRRTYQQYGQPVRRARVRCRTGSADSYIWTGIQNPCVSSGNKSADL
jgi:hypothetical protein